MTIVRMQHQSSFVKPERRYIRHTSMSCEAIGYYAMMEVGGIKLDDVPNEIIEQMKEAGYVKEVKE